MRQKLFPESEHPKGHTDLALSYNTIGMVYSAMGKRDEALAYLQKGLAMRERLFPQGNADVATSSNNVGLLLRDMDRLEESLKYLERALTIRQKLFPNGHPHLASSMNNVALIHESLGRFDSALNYYEQSLAMRRKLYPATTFKNGHPDISTALNNLAGLYNVMGQHEKALEHYEQALVIDEKLFGPTRYPKGHPTLATTYNNLGLILKTLGRFEEARARYEQSLAIRSALYPESKYPLGHEELATSFNNLSILFQETGRFDLSLQYAEKSHAMREKLLPVGRYPDGHPSLADSMLRMGGLLHAMGRSENAVAYLEQALAMSRRLFGPKRFPQGRPELALRLGNHAVFLGAIGKTEAAFEYAREAYELFRRVYPANKYPDGHADLAWSARVLGNQYFTRDQLAEAKKYFEESFAMYQRLFPEPKYPNGHLNLFEGLNCLGMLAVFEGKYETALRYCDEGQKMLERIFPTKEHPLGHPYIVVNRDNIAAAKSELGQRNEAVALLDRSLRMEEKLATRDLTAASEADALARSEDQMKRLHFLLSLTRQDASRAAADYDLIWSAKASVMRLLSLRHAATRIALADPKGDARIRAKWDELISVRHRLGQLMHQPTPDPRKRDELLSSLNDRQDRVERELAELVPDLDSVRQSDRETPADLSRRLPKGTVLIDFMRYGQSKYLARVGASKRTKEFHYLAYVVAPGQAPRRVELGPANTIDESIRQWRQSIGTGNDASAAGAVRDLIWKPLAEHLPNDARTIFLAVDGELASIPFAALPGRRPNSVLLEELAIAFVPHGPFLWKQLVQGKKSEPSPQSFLGIGAVDFGAVSGKKAYAALPGTETELKHIGALAVGGRSRLLTGAECTSARVAAELPNASVAHFATHGFFDRDALKAERQRYQDFLVSWREKSDTLGRVGLGRKNPLAFTGLALANANQSPDAVWTGESIVNLPLEKLALVTLSACETGLGDLTGGEGVFGLTRAFHLAGCPNVVASLWKVSDSATAALMAKFYHELWVNKKPPIEALREAQLTIYRHPERIPALAGERGKPDFNKTVELKVEPPASANAEKRTPTKLWAAFVLSGVGR